MASTKRLTIDEVKRRIKKIHNGKVILDESTYITTRVPARFIDSEFGEWFAQVSYVMRGGSHPKRGNIKRAKSGLISLEVIKKRIFNIFGDLVTLDESTYKQTNVKARFIDKEFGEWWALPNQVLHKHGHFKRKCENQKKPISIFIPNDIGTYSNKEIAIENVSPNKSSGIYCILNTRDNKKYIGSSFDIGARFREHKYRLKFNKHHSPHLQYAWNRDGKASFLFFIIELVDENNLLKREKYWMDYYKSYDEEFGYNIEKIPGSFK